MYTHNNRTINNGVWALTCTRDTMVREKSSKRKSKPHTPQAPTCTCTYMFGYMDALDRRLHRTMRNFDYCG